MGKRLEFAEIHQGEKIIAYFYDERGNMIFKKKFYSFLKAYEYAQKKVRVLVIKNRKNIVKKAKKVLKNQ